MSFAQTIISHILKKHKSCQNHIHHIHTIKHGIIDFYENTSGSDTTVGLRVEYPIWLEHKCSGIYNFYPLTHQGSHAFHKNRRKGKRNLPLVDRFVKPSEFAPWFIRIFKGAAFLKNNHPLQVSTHEQIMNDLSEC